MGKPVALWISDRQDAFVTGIAAEFPDVPHRYCDNHFLRDVAKPVLEADSHAKVQMRKKVRGLRTDRTSRARSSSAAERRESPAADDPEAAVAVTARSSVAARRRPGSDSACAVVLDYCTAVRGILNDDQGGPLDPPGLRMAEALNEVRDSIQRNLDEKKGGSRRSNSAAWPAASTAVWTKSGREQETIRDYVQDIAEVAATLEPGDAEIARERQEKFEELIDRSRQTEDPIHQHMAEVMISFLGRPFRRRRRV